MTMKSILNFFAVTLLAMLYLVNQAYADNAMHIVINDHLGTPQMLVDENRNVVWQAEYDEFGKAHILVQQVEFNQRFPGQYYDKETGLHYNYYRDYDSALGRYVQSDPIGLAGGINTYAYVEGNPLRWSDPTGLIKHTTGKTIECGKNCTIRIDTTLDERTGIVKRHLHWSCRGDQGVCGENGESSHGGTWEDAPESVKECARRNGFEGQNETDSSQDSLMDAAEAGAGALGVGVMTYLIISEGTRIIPFRNLIPIP